MGCHPFTRDSVGAILGSLISDSIEDTAVTAMKFVCGLLAALLLVMGTAAFAQRFAGQNITVIVNNSAGGPADIAARLVARHLPKYLQGVNSIVVGAGGERVIAELANVQPSLVNFLRRYIEAM